MSPAYVGLFHDSMKARGEGVRGCHILRMLLSVQLSTDGCHAAMAISRIIDAA